MYEKLIQQSPTPRLLRVRDVQLVVNVARSTLYRWIKDGHFPAPVLIGPRAIGWYETDVAHWIAARSKVGGQ